MSKKKVRKKRRYNKKQKKEFDTLLFIKSFFFTMLLILFMFLIAVVDYRSRGVAGYVDASAFSFGINNGHMDISIFNESFSLKVPELLKKFIDFIMSLF